MLEQFAAARRAHIYADSHGSSPLLPRDLDILRSMSGLPLQIGPYRIVRQLGAGGMGAVFEAVHQATERRVAIKVLLPEYARDADMTARFFNEARAVNKIEHLGIVQVFDYERQENGCAYIAMELLKGETLRARLDRGPTVRPLGEALRLSWQIASALAAAHAQGIVHRSLNERNYVAKSND